MKISGKLARAAFVLVNLALLGSCGGNGSNPVDDPSQATISPTRGAELVAPDNRMRVIIPAGAVASETRVSVDLATSSDLPAAAGLGGADIVYALSPAGIVFSRPVSVELILPPAKSTVDGFELPDISHVHENGTVSRPNNLTVTADPAGDTLASFELEGFSWIARASAPEATVAVTPSSINAQVGVPFKFDTVVTWTKSEPNAGPANNAYFTLPAQELTDCYDATGQGGIVAGSPIAGEVFGVCVGVGTPSFARASASTLSVNKDFCMSMGVKVTINCAANPQLADLPGTQLVGRTETILTLKIGGKYYPSGQFHKAGADACDSEHWHGGSVFPIAGDPDGPDTGVGPVFNVDYQKSIGDPVPGGCGFGKVSEVPLKVLTLSQDDWNQFLTNHGL